MLSLSLSLSALLCLPMIPIRSNLTSVLTMFGLVRLGLVWSIQIPLPYFTLPCPILTLSDPCQALHSTLPWLTDQHDII